MNRMMAAQVDAKPRYEFKAGPYGSHKHLLTRCPERGGERRVLDLGCAVGYLSEILAERGFPVVCIDWPGTPHPATVEFSGAALIEHRRDPLSTHLARVSKTLFAYRFIVTARGIAAGKDT